MTFPSAALDSLRPTSPLLPVPAGRFAAAEHEPTATRAAASSVGHHRGSTTAPTMTIEMTRYLTRYPSPEERRARRSLTGAGIRKCRHLVRPAGRVAAPPVAGDEFGRPGTRGGLPAEADPQPGSSSASKVGGRRATVGEALQEVAADRPGVLDLHPADRSGGQLQPVEEGRQVGREHIGPGRQRGDPPRIAVVVTPRSPGRAVMSSTGRSIGREGEGRVDVRTAASRMPSGCSRRNRGWSSRAARTSTPPSPRGPSTVRS